MYRKATAAVLVMLMLTACGPERTQPQMQNPPSDSTTPALPNCEDIYGMPTEELLSLGACMDGVQVIVLALASYDCADGSRVYWNDYGWGYSTGTWQRHSRPDGQLVPPDEVLNNCG